MAPELIRATVCSANPHKLAEFEALFPGVELELLGADEFPPEDGDTYRENALIKARFGRRIGRPDSVMLADDSGIEVAALRGRPGVETARWAEGRHVEKLLAALGDTDDRGARYACELVAVLPDGSERHGVGFLEGAIARAPAGDEGFGFDPIFVPTGEERTVAELGNDWKAVNSHRARAAQALLWALRRPASVTLP